MNESDEGLRFEVDVFTGKGFLVFVLFFVRRKEKEREGGKGEGSVLLLGLDFTLESQRKTVEKKIKIK